MCRHNISRDLFLQFVKSTHSELHSSRAVCQQCLYNLQRVQIHSLHKVMSTMTIQFGNSTNTQLTRCVSTMTVVDKIKQLQDGTAVKLMTYYYISLS